SGFQIGISGPPWVAATHRTLPAEAVRPLSIHHRRSASNPFHLRLTDPRRSPARNKGSLKEQPRSITMLGSELRSECFVRGTRSHGRYRPDQSPLRDLLLGSRARDAVSRRQGGLAGRQPAAP